MRRACSSLTRRSCPRRAPAVSRNLSLRSVFRQCFDVVRRRVDGRRLPIRYATAMAFSASCMMIFVTNSSFIYMQYFGVGPARFSVLFAMSVLGFMSLNLFSMWRLKSHNAGTFFRVGLTIQVVVVAGLLTVVATGHAALSDGRAVHRARRRDARARRPGGLVALHGLLPRARGQRVVGLHDDDVPARRYVRLAERCA